MRKLSVIGLAAMAAIMLTACGSSSLSSFKDSYLKASYDDVHLWVNDVDRMQAFADSNGRGSSPDMYLFSTTYSVAELFNNESEEALKEEDLVVATETLIKSLEMKEVEDASLDQLIFRVDLEDDCIFEIYTNGNGRLIRGKGTDKKEVSFHVENYSVVEDYVAEAKRIVASWKA